ncbi:uncharacterized protein [Temnothorax longispinosus]|uniref:uncharacterized protein n=1 Tax=Temnothorax longispinosus TaxID=300112 RepID=UPI003A99186E
MRLSHIENHIDQQLTLMGIIAKTVDNLLTIGRENVMPHMVHTRIADLQDNWDQFSIRHHAIGMAVRGLNAEERLSVINHAYFSEGLFSKTHQSYLREIDKLNSLLAPEHPAPEQVSATPTTFTQPLSREQESVPPSTSTQFRSNNPDYHYHSRLPEIELPKFDGVQSNWLSFKDLFSSIVIKRPSLTSVEKLQLLVNEALQALFSLKRMTKESHKEMEMLYTNLTQIYRTLETLQRPVETWDDVFVFTAVQRLDSESVKAWENHLGSNKQPPTWEQFKDFLFNRLHSLQAFEKCTLGKSVPSAKSHFSGKPKDDKAGKKNSCVICSAKHYVAHCPQYTAKTIEQRLAIIAKHKLCFNCLGLHRASACRVTTRCLKCGSKHHTTIHKFKGKQTNSDQATAKAEPQTDSSSTSTKEQASQSTSTNTNAKAVNSTSVSQLTSVLLATAQIIIEGPNGEFTKARALIDQGSEISLITEKIVQRLNLPRRHSFIPLIGIGAEKTRKTRGIVNFKFKPHFNSEYEGSICAHILPKLTASLPSLRCEESAWEHLKNLQFADPKFTVPGSIDVILGADIYSNLIEEGIVKGAVDTPLAQCTKLGWIISGPAGNAPTSSLTQSLHVSIDRELYDLIQRFWEMETVPFSNNSSLTAEDQQCELHFQSTHTRDASGRYQVRLPFKQPANKLGDSRMKAVQVLNSLSKRLTSDSRYAEAYQGFMDEFEKLQHMTLVPESDPEPQLVYYLPHHGVLRENDLNRIRVVFNGSSPTTTGCSLNDLLHTGAKLQINVFDVLIGTFNEFCGFFDQKESLPLELLTEHCDLRIYLFPILSPSDSDTIDKR